MLTPPLTPATPKGQQSQKCGVPTTAVDTRKAERECISHLAQNVGSEVRQSSPVRLSWARRVEPPFAA